MTPTLFLLAIYLWLIAAVLMRSLATGTAIEAEKDWYWLLWPLLPLLALGIWLFDRVKGLGR